MRSFKRYVSPSFSIIPCLINPSSAFHMAAVSLDRWNIHCPVRRGNRFHARFGNTAASAHDFDDRFLPASEFHDSFSDQFSSYNFLYSSAFCSAILFFLVESIQKEFDHHQSKYTDQRVGKRAIMGFVDDASSCDYKASRSDDDIKYCDNFFEHGDSLG